MRISLRRSRSQLGRAVMGIVAMAGAGALIAHPLSLRVLATWPLFLLLIALFFVAETYVVRIYGARVSLHLPIALAAFWRLGPEAGIWIAALGSVSADVYRHRPAFICCVNGALRAVQVTAGAAMSVWLSAHCGMPGWSNMWWRADPLAPTNTATFLLLAATFMVAYVVIGEGVVAGILFLRIEDYARRWRSNLPSQISALGIEAGYSVLLILGDPLRSWFTTGLFFLPMFAVGRLWQVSQDLQNSSARLGMLLAAADLLSAQNSFAQSSARLLAELRKVLVFTMGAIAAVESPSDGQGEKVLRLVAVHGLPEFIVREFRHRLGEGLIAAVIDGGSPRLIPDVHALPDYHPGNALVDQLRCAILVPVVVEGESRAILAIAHALPQAFSQDDVQLLAALAHHIGVAIRNQQHIEERAHLAVVEERNRVGRDVHDGVAQLLGSAILQVDLLERQVPLEPQAILQQLRQQRATLRKCMTELRRVIFNLRPVHGEPRRAILAAVEARARTLARESGLNVVFTTVGRVVDLSGVLQSNVFYIVTEAVSNACRHSGGNSVRVELAFLPTLLRITVSDDGCGFHLAEAMARTERDDHHGLDSLNERTQQLGGRLAIDSRIGQGTSVRVELPLPDVAQDVPPIVVDVPS